MLPLDTPTAKPEATGLGSTGATPKKEGKRQTLYACSLFKPQMLTLSTTIVIRVPKELKDELVKLGIDYAEEVRKLLEEIVRRGKKRGGY